MSKYIGKYGMCFHFSMKASILACTLSDLIMGLKITEKLGRWASNVYPVCVCVYVCVCVQMCVCVSKILSGP